jgi:putative selenium metabolism protein SsnA
MPSRILVENGTIITFGKACQVLEDHALLIEGDRIARIAPKAELQGPFDKVIDAKGKVVMPGLVNAHMHFYSTLVRGLGKAAPSCDFQEVLENLWWRLDKKLSLDDTYYSAKVMLVEAIKKGTTTLIDHHASPGAVRGSLDLIAKAVKETGLRASLCYELSDRDGDKVADEGLEENAAFAQRCKRENDPFLRAHFGLHAAFTISDATMARASKLGHDAGVGFHVHVAEAASDVAHNVERYGKRVVERLDAHGILGEQTLAAHCVHINEKEVETLARTRTMVATNTQSNLNNAVGVVDLVRLQGAGVLAGLGTDAMTVNMLEETRVALWAQHLRANNPSCAFMEVAGAITAKNPEIASRVWGFPVGELKEGAAADVILLDYLAPTPLDNGTVLGHLIFGISQAVVDTTICGGRVLMEGRKLALDLDEVEMAARSRELAVKLWDRF